MPRLRIAAYNVAWFARLFDRRNRLVDDRASSAMPGVTRHRQAEAAAAVIRAVDADLYAVIEAPNSGSRQSCAVELETFARAFGLRQRAALIGFENPTEQEIALLFDPDRLRARHAPIGELLDAARARAGPSPFGAPRFDGLYPADLDGDGVPELHQFAKPPLEAVVQGRAGASAFRLIAVHLKSKLAEDGPADRRRAARAARLAETAWLRARIDEHLAAGEDLVVLGDFNEQPAEGDGCLARIVGDPPARLVDPHATLPPGRAGPAPSTARFRDEDTGAVQAALVDFVLLSPGLAARARPAWRIWHPDDDPACRGDATLRQALLDASDHFPVSVDLELR